MHANVIHHKNMPANVVPISLEHACKCHTSLKHACKCHTSLEHACKCHTSLEHDYKARGVELVI